jgi:spore coat polysaccharide biosynthesis protein SpsF
MPYKTEQEKFWAGQFGDDYISRNKGGALLASNLNFFSRALQQTSGLTSCLEFGANIGMNLRALKLLYPNIRQQGIEINKSASEELINFLGKDNVYNQSILSFKSDIKYDLVLIKGVLIHQDPDVLPIIYSKLHRATSKYILISEYYNPSPVAVLYRGHEEKLFKRDFAGEMLDKFSDLKLVDYGFVYRRDPSFPQDDITWFLLKKS